MITRDELESTPRDEAPSEATEELQTHPPVLAFRTGTTWLAVDALATLEIAPYPTLSAVPLAPPHVLGITWRRSHATPVLDPARLLDLPPAPPRDPYSRLVVVRALGMQVALAAQQVGGVLEPASAEVDAPTLLRTGLAAELARAEFSGPGGPVTVLDLEGLLRAARIER